MKRGSLKITWDKARNAGEIRGVINPGKLHKENAGRWESIVRGMERGN